MYQDRVGHLNSEISTTPADLKDTLLRIVHGNIRSSLMIWGAPGIGKSSIVADVAAGLGLNLVDLRLSQLAPTDLRGLPVPGDGIVKWYPPEFLPRDGKGILFLDELNMAPPALQGVAQQLILDRRVGNYQVPDGWFIWAAGNRKEDRASVFDMPAPLANRFLHFHVAPDFESFKRYALENGIHEHVLAFLSFRPALMHKLTPGEPAWPSPRSWEMASRLKAAGVDVSAAVGRAAALEFNAFVRLYDQMPDLDAILAGRAKAEFPEEPSARYAVVIGLTVRCADFSSVSGDQIRNAGTWIGQLAPPEWFQLFVSDLVRLARTREDGMRYLQPLLRDPRVREAVATIRSLLFE